MGTSERRSTPLGKPILAPGKKMARGRSSAWVGLHTAPRSVTPPQVGALCPASLRTDWRHQEPHYSMLTKPQVSHSEAWQLFYFRTKEGAEVDLVLEPTQGEATPIAAEIKHTQTFTPALLRGLKAFGRAHGSARSVLISNIEKPPPLGDTLFQSP